MSQRIRKTLAGALLLGAAAAPAAADLLSTGPGPAGSPALAQALRAYRSVDWAPRVRIEPAPAPALRASRSSQGPVVARVEARGPAMRLAGKEAPRAGIRPGAPREPAIILASKAGPIAWTALDVEGPLLGLLPAGQPGLRRFFEEDDGAGAFAKARGLLPVAFQVPVTGPAAGTWNPPFALPAHAGAFGLGFDVDKHYFGDRGPAERPDLGAPPVPEPGSLVLTALGLLGVAFYRRKLFPTR